MSIVLATLWLSMFGLLIFASPKRKRYRGRRGSGRQRHTFVSDSSIDGDDVDLAGGDSDGSTGADFGGADVGSGDCGGGDGGGDCGGGGD